MYNKKLAKKFFFSPSVANSRPARELIRLSLLHCASKAPELLHVWIAGGKAEALARKIFAVIALSGAQNHPRLRGLSPRDPLCTGDDVLQILAKILVFCGCHTTSPLYSGKLIRYLVDLRLALVLGSVSGASAIEAAEEQGTEEEEQRAQEVAAWIESDLGLDLDAVRQGIASIRHYDLDALKGSLAAVRGIVESVVHRGLMKKEILVDEVQILLVAARLSVVRDETAVLLNYAQLQPLFDVLQKGGVRNIFGSMPALGNIICLNVEARPSLVMDVCNWLTGDDARLDLIQGQWGHGLYRLLTFSRRHGTQALDSLSTIVREWAQNGSGRIRQVFPLWRDSVEHEVDRQIGVCGAARQEALTKATEVALADVEAAAELAARHGAGGSDSFYALVNKARDL